jgi:uncharacterized protein (DUF488 family)
MRLSEMNTLFTIGHSTHDLSFFLDLLKMHDVQAVADVRSQPFSARFPQFTRSNLEKSLKAHHIRYVFLGHELGARRDEACCYLDGQARYELVAKTSAFHEGMARILKGLEKYRLALLCAEKDPITCHRTILVCRHLRGRGFQIRHILGDGRLEAHDKLEERMLKLMGKSQPSLFISREELVEQAYEEQGEKIAYRQSPNASDEELHSTRIA